MANLSEHLSPQTIRIAGMFFVDGLTQPQIAREIGIHKGNVCRALTAVELTCYRLGLPVPKRAASKKIRQLTEGMMASL